MTWWLAMAVGAAVGALVALLAARELGVYRQTRRAITIDLVGARPLRDPDDWFDR